LTKAFLPLFLTSASKFDLVSSTAPALALATRAAERTSKRATILFTALAGASAALELTKANFDTEVKQSGKNAFVKFLAPW